MVTYNHEKWIDQAIEGVLMQKAAFTFDLVIGEDCSTDKTADIIRTYSGKNPEKIKAHFNQKNLGLAKNFSQLLNKCSGKYIAICEGDDFWTDPDKLSKQVEFLELNPGYIICSHNSSRYYETGKIFNCNNKYSENFTYDQERFLKEWVTQPLTCVFRNLFRDYTFLNNENMFCDVIFFYELLKHGKGYFMKDNMATFRVHDDALSSGLSQWQWLRNHVLMFDCLFKYNKKDSRLQKISSNYCLSLYIYNLKKTQNKNHVFKPLQEALKRKPGIFNKLFTVMVKVPYYVIRYGLFSSIRSGII